jgi:ribosomal protein S18 acetylase RimI-like enzyme/predicted nucleic acid-binding protein
MLLVRFFDSSFASNVARNRLITGQVDPPQEPWYFGLLVKAIGYVLEVASLHPPKPSETWKRIEAVRTPPPIPERQLSGPQTPPPVVRCVDPLSNEERAEVYRLYRTHSAMLGFFPQGAMDGLVRDGTVLVAVAGPEILGYLAYRVSGASAKVVHLCVSSEHRGSGVGRALCEELFRETRHLQDVRLYCREDYLLNSFWPRLGFVFSGEKLGRGKEGKRLFLWVRRNETQPLFAALDAASRANRLTAAVDANVFFDFDRSDDRAHESKGLLADWLTDEVVICLTAEILNEISRHGDSDLRLKRRGQVVEFTVLQGTPEAFTRALESIRSVLSTPEDLRDESDRRQLAHAVAERAAYFITRDGVLLEHSAAIRERVGIEVLRPTDFLVRLHAVSSVGYEPVRLVGTHVTTSRVTREADLLPFQHFAHGEPKARWYQRVRTALADPHRFETQLVSADGNPLVAYSVEITSDVVHLHMLRAHRDPLASTLLRRVVAETIARATTKTPTRVVCSDGGDRVVEAALYELGFVRNRDSFERFAWRTVLDSSRLTVEACGIVDVAAPPIELEKNCWPLKLSGANISSYVVPIRPHWAAQLFDARLAEGDLFGAKLETALALENVYYSSSSVAIPVGARILWYVSDTVKEIRACSISLGSVRAPARDLFRQFRRLGIYRWQDLMRKTGENPDQLMHGYRFAFTERFEKSVKWSEFQEILASHTGHGNPVAGPVRLPEQVFLDVYRTATGH